MEDIQTNDATKRKPSNLERKEPVFFRRGTSLLACKRNRTLCLTENTWASDDESAESEALSRTCDFGKSTDRHETVKAISCHEKFRKFVKAKQLIFQGPLVPTNLSEAKQGFLRHDIDPTFKLVADARLLEKLLNSRVADISLEQFHKAKRILDAVIDLYGSLDQFVIDAYGKSISNKEASKSVNSYIRRHGLEKQIRVVWCENLASSAQLNSHGRYGEEKYTCGKSYTLLIKSSSENRFLRQRGITCLMDHEIGTHYFRSRNEGFQWWHSNREGYGLSCRKSIEVLKSEEGLASIHTLLRAKQKFLCMPALLYYTACMAEYMTFRELFQHLSKYMKNEEQRWKHCMRVKRSLLNVNNAGGYGKDQRYFEGAVELLENQHVIDFVLLMSGKIHWKDISLIKHCVKREKILLPDFMRNFKFYKAEIARIASINGIESKPSADKQFRKFTNRQAIVSQLLKLSPKTAPSNGYGCCCRLYTGADACGRINPMMVELFMDNPLQTP